MRICFRLRHDMPDRPTTADQCIGDQGPMASLGNGFRAHDGSPQLSAVSLQLIEGLPKCF